MTDRLTPAFSLSTGGTCTAANVTAYFKPRDAVACTSVVALNDIHQLTLVGCLIKDRGFCVQKTDLDGNLLNLRWCAPAFNISAPEFKDSSMSIAMDVARTSFVVTVDDRTANSVGPNVFRVGFGKMNLLSNATVAARLDGQAKGVWGHPR